jgi:hypothetical protein
MSEEPPNRAPERLPVGGEKWFLTIFAAIFIGLMGAEILSDFEIRRLSAVFILVFWIPLLVVHEFGHAIAAKLCGWAVDRIVIGYGPTLHTFHWGGTLIHLKAIPLSGYVLPRPTNLKIPRLKSTIIYAAGPAVEAFLALGLLFLVGPETMFHVSDSLTIVMAQSFCVSAAMGLIFTLVPHVTTTGGGKSWSDGMGILMSWRLPDEYFSARINASPNTAET